MYTSNLIDKVTKKNPAEMNRNDSKAPLQFPAIACIRHVMLLF